MAQARTTFRTRTRHGESEQHFSAGEAVRDVVLGMADGLTVPFALAAGITGAIGASHVVVTAGIAEIAAGGISMGLGGYLAAHSDAEHYASEHRRELLETDALPEEERREIEGIFASYGISGPELQSLTDHITADKARWVDFMMKFELGLDRPDPRTAPASAARVGGSYVVGGLIPLLPYFATRDTHAALLWSTGLSLCALFAFGAVKAYFTGAPLVRSAVQTALIGGIAAAVAYTLARLVT
jgi:VIT1/CCC1 family predicted Fe2+/Mn2+ transporter